MADPRNPEDALDSTSLDFQDLIAALGLGAKKETVYNVGIRPGPRPGSFIEDIKTAEDIYYSYRNLPSDQIARYQLALQKMGYKTKPTGKLDTKTQAEQYFKGIFDTVSVYSEVLKFTDPTDLNKVVNLSEFFNRSAAEGGADKASRSVLESVYLTPEADAIQYFNNLYRTYTGSDASVEEARKFAQQLNKRERQSVQRQITTTKGDVTRTEVTKSGFDDLDREELALKFIERKLTDDNIITMGGQIGANLKTIDGLLRAYNITLDPTTRKDYLISSLKSKNGLEDVTNRIQKLASIQYKALAPYFEQGYSPGEVLGGFLDIKSRLYGTPNLDPNPWNDKDIVWLAQQDKLPDNQTWETRLLNAPEAEYSPGFRERAANFTIEVGKMLGFA
jgi:hypothetical protein